MDLGQNEMVRLYGPWAGRRPTDAADFFGAYAGLWWVAGGWALEAFSGLARSHDDIDISVLRAELPLLRRYLDGQLDVWTAASGALWPLRPADRPSAAPDDLLPIDCGQVWTRRSAMDPWEFDILLSPGDANTWVYKRDPRLQLPMADALWEREGIRYLQPEIQLLYKARGLRPKDQADLAAALPHLDARRREWLKGAVQTTLPGHPWLQLMD